MLLCTAKIGELDAWDIASNEVLCKKDVPALHVHKCVLASTTKLSSGANKISKIWPALNVDDLGRTQPALMVISRVSWVLPQRRVVDTICLSIDRQVASRQ